jgi:hypothetical protein
MLTSIVPCEKHCAHKTNHYLACNPPIYVAVCCHCGQHGKLYAKRCSGHGPHYPVTEYNLDEVVWDNDKLL